jgi:hypothetical protein
MVASVVTLRSETLVRAEPVKASHAPVWRANSDRGLR